MRCLIGVGAICALLAGGCSNFFPSFNKSNVLAYPAHGGVIPLAEVSNSVKCEMGKFLKTHFKKARINNTTHFQLDEKGEATIILEVAVSTEGGVNYTEVNLQDGDLLTAILVAGADDIKAPKLEVNGTGTVTAKVTLKMEQKPWEPNRWCHEHHVLANSLNPFTLGEEKLGLTTWLTDFFDKTWARQIPNLPTTTLSEIELDTKFILVAELSSSFRRLIRIVPISNFPLGTLQQNVTNKLTVKFKGKEKNDPKPEGEKKDGPTISDCLIAEAAKQPMNKHCSKKLKGWRA